VRGRRHPPRGGPVAPLPGPSSKLSAPFRGKPLALHAAQTLDRFDFAERICVTSEATGPVASAIAALGYRMVEQPHPELGLGASLALGVRCVPSRKLR
jgi:CTP:molybdopterin cytidylyltransferase MocA